MNTAKCPTTLRPHYHILFFGVNSFELSHSLADWENLFGYTLAKDVEYNSDSMIKTSKYVSKYCSKGIFENPKVVSQIVEKPFRLVSKGLGSTYVDKMKYHHLLSLKNDYQTILQRRLVVLPNNTSYPMPRYYKTKIYGQKNLLSYRLLVQMEALSDDLYLQRTASVQARNPNWTSLQTFRYLDMQNIEDAKYKSESRFRELAKFYQKSKI